MPVRIFEEERMLGRIEAARRTNRPAETFDVSWREDIRYGMRASEETCMPATKEFSNTTMSAEQTPRVKSPAQSNNEPPPWMNPMQRRRWHERRAQREANRKAELAAQESIWSKWFERQTA